MNKKLTEVVFILDKSGSMSGLESDTIGGFNSMLEKQRKVEGEAIVSTVLFNSRFDVIHNRVNVVEVKPLTQKEYVVEGMTALLDAVGRAIHKIRHIYDETLQEDRPSKVLFIVTTDGMENSSREYCYSKVQQMIQEVKEKYNWEFLFLGANIDAIGEAKKFGIDQEHAVQYHSDKEGTSKNYDAINEAVISLRMTNMIKKNWKKNIEDDFKKRKK